MKTDRTLASLETGDFAQVQTLHVSGAVRRRLQDIGLTENTPVQCVQKSISGDPAAYLIRGAVIALRKQDAEKIAIIPQKKPLS